MSVDFQLLHRPFGVTPDAHYLFASETHREALASLLYGIKANRGFIALIAYPGMGKTTLLLESLKRFEGFAKTVFVFQAITTPLDFLHIVLNDLGVNELPTGGLVELQVKFAEVLAELERQGRQLIVAVDEAQNLDNSVLEFIRMLSNFETSKGKLMQIILAGQPRLARKLASPDLVQLRQRISIVAHLKPFSSVETELYIKHRLRAGGYCGADSVFTPEALQMIAQQSGGIPRNINNLCFNALSLGRALKKVQIDADILNEVIDDLDLQPLIGGTTSSDKRSRSRSKGLTGHLLRRWVPGTVIAMVALCTLSMIAPALERQVIAQTDLVRANVPSASLPGSHLTAIQNEGTNPEPAEPSKPDERERPLDSNPAFHEISSPRHSGAVVVMPGATFNDMCAEVVTSRYTTEVDAIRRVNPWPSNSTRILVGQKIHLPPATAQSAASTPENHSSTSAR
jgi:general secretion pathway protein A